MCSTSTRRICLCPLISGKMFVRKYMNSVMVSLSKNGNKINDKMTIQEGKLLPLEVIKNFTQKNILMEIDPTKSYNIIDDCSVDALLTLSRKVNLNKLMGIFQESPSKYYDTINTSDTYDFLKCVLHYGMSFSRRSPMITSVESKGKSRTKFSKIPIFWVLGGPGSGKGTQCALLVKKYGFVHLSSGDLLRAEVASGSKKGKELSALMVNGALVPREIILNLLKQTMLNKIGSAKGYLIDGFPREAEQAEDFERMISPCNLIIYYKCSDETLKERVLLRSRGSGRADDNEKTLLKRLDTFYTYSRPLKFMYESKIATIESDTAGVDNIFKTTCVEIDRIIRSLQ